MADSAWTPVDESAVKWTPGQEAASLGDRVKTAFAALPVEHSQGPYGIPGSFEGHPENVGEWVPAGPGQIGAGAVDVARGNIARGGHKMISGAGNTLLPTLPFVAAAAPLATARGIVGGTVGSEPGQRGGGALGASG